jgi:hypothetical protein
MSNEVLGRQCSEAIEGGDCNSHSNEQNERVITSLFATASFLLSHPPARGRTRRVGCASCRLLRTHSLCKHDKSDASQHVVGPPDGKGVEAEQGHGHQGLQGLQQDGTHGGRHTLMGNDRLQHSWTKRCFNIAETLQLRQQ